MPALGKKKGGKFEAVYQVHIHSIESWPASATGSPLLVSWERGTSHKGSLEATQPTVRAGGAVFEFEETISVPCTLVQVQCSNTALSAVLGPIDTLQNDPLHNKSRL